MNIAIIETVTVDVDFNHYMDVDGKIHTLTKHIPETTIYFDGNILNTVELSQVLYKIYQK